mmetsp:Transcript_958/g.1796  ORF Transcript_958/g.1796 Transcript_958/m.1796 type:complete len:727 (-) Transcript_958:722-2902(-)|eukprot:CAMPEP_0182443604 /NCGR_PEP_ID=MMETSP1172-20130603/2303_1 /TAXON_ID=708627 /ORGANISM="Timspurckia oligopyrenoides, Strain CCMP3278" /LENGTH=726 /DNA_ID=CAMNT_0024638945 /DNA_START=181 /DNA_END=2361 /DNA_ORIENTATION=+
MAARVGKYLLFETLGEGAFGKVKLGVHEDTGEQVAVKCMDKADIKAQEMTMNVRREIAIMKALKHKNIVNMLQVLSSSSKLYIVMELVTGGELFTKILNEGKLPEDLARRYFQNVIDGVDYCHARGVCHRDLKPENLLIEDTSGELKITDFGLSAMRGTSTAEELHLLHTQCGSPNYCAPEIITSARKGYNGVMVDVWSCGIILFALLAGYLPFYDENTRNLYKMIQHDQVKYPKKFPPGAKDLCERLLTKSPDRRITMAEVKQHPWFLIDYNGDGVLKGGLQLISAPGEKKKSLAPKESDQDDEETDEDAKKKTEMLKAAISKRQLIAAEEMELQRKKSMDPQKVVQEHENSAAVRSIVKRYEKLFELDESGKLARTTSFRQTKGSPGSIIRAKNIAAAEYMALRRQIQFEDEGTGMESSEVSSGTLKAFEKLLDFFESKKREAGKENWFNAISQLSEDEMDKLEALCQILEPDDEDKVEEVVGGDDTAVAAAGVAQTAATEDTDASSAVDAVPIDMTPYEDAAANGRATVVPKGVDDNYVASARTVSNASKASSSSNTYSNVTTKVSSPTEHSSNNNNSSILDRGGSQRAAPPPSQQAVSAVPAAVASTVQTKRASGFAKILGLGAASGTSFDTDLPPERALREVGKILTLDGYQVMMKRGDNTKMKMELPIGAEKMLLAVSAEKKGPKTMVVIKRSGGKADPRALEDFFQSLLVKFNQNVRTK